MLPKFPDFDKLHISHKKAVEKYTLTFPPYSDHNFTSLLSWNVNLNTHVSTLNGNLVVKMGDYLNGSPVYSFFGTKDILKTVKTMLDYLGNQPGAVLSLIPEIAIQAHPNILKEFHIEEDRDNFDYVYSIPEIIGMKGNKFSAKRNFINRFKRLYKSSYRLIDLKDRLIQKQMLDLFKTWKENHKKKHSGNKKRIFGR